MCLAAFFPLEGLDSLTSFVEGIFLETVFFATAVFTVVFLGDALLSEDWEVFLAGVATFFGAERTAFFATLAWGFFTALAAGLFEDFTTFLGVGFLAMV